MKTKALQYLRYFRLFWSLKFAVIVMISLTSALAAATFVESAYDTLTAQHYVYRAPWFLALLGLLGINIITVALSRLPWKLRHAPFLLAHLGIVLLLVGACLSQFHGLDGVMEIREGDRTAEVVLDDHVLVIQDGEKAHVAEIPRLPPGVEFERDFPALGVQVLQYEAHAERKIELEPVTGRTVASVKARPALLVSLHSKRAGIQRKFWLWTGDEARAMHSEGPLEMKLLREGEVLSAPLPKRNDLPLAAFMEIQLLPSETKLNLFDTRGKSKSVSVPANETEGFMLETGWMDFVLKVEQFAPDAELVEKYLPAEVQYGDGGAEPALRLKTASGTEFWLQRGQHKRVDEKVLSFMRRRVTLPFEIELIEFRADFDHAARNPSSFVSIVRVRDGDIPQVRALEMNQPLEVANYSFYQSGYRALSSEREISVLAVNRDPGRALKYWGSLCIVLGSVLLFLRKWLERRTLQTSV